MIEITENRLIKIFQELQEDGLIAKNRQLKKSIFTYQIQGVFNRIRYNESFYNQNLSQLNDLQIKYVLLHEEGHIIKGSFKEYIWVFFFILGGIFLFYWPLNGIFDFVFKYNGQYYSISGLGAFITQIFSTVVYILIFLPLFFRLFYKMMYNAEFIADEYAAASLKINYGVKYPSIIMNETFNSILSRNKLKIKGRIPLILLQIFGVYPDYHPSEVERLQNIITKFEYNQ